MREPSNYISYAAGKFIVADLAPRAPVKFQRAEIKRSSSADEKFFST